MITGQVSAIGKCNRNTSQNFSGWLPGKRVEIPYRHAIGVRNRPTIFYGHDIGDDIKNRIRQWFSND